MGDRRLLYPAEAEPVLHKTPFDWTPSDTVPPVAKRPLLFPAEAEVVLRAPDPPAETPFDWMSTGVVFPAGGRFLAYQGVTPPPPVTTIPILYPPPQQADTFPPARLAPAVPESRPDRLPSIPVGWDTQMKIETVTPPPPQIEGGEVGPGSILETVPRLDWLVVPYLIRPHPVQLAGGEARPEAVTVPSLAEWFVLPFLPPPPPVQLEGGSVLPEIFIAVPAPSIDWLLQPQVPFPRALLVLDVGEARNLLPPVLDFGWLTQQADVLLRRFLLLEGGEARTERIEVVPDIGWILQQLEVFPRARLAPDIPESLPSRILEAPPLSWVTAWSLVGRMPSLLYPVRGEPPPAEIVTPEALPDLDWLVFTPPLFRPARLAPDVPEARDLTVPGLDLGWLTVLPPFFRPARPVPDVTEARDPTLPALSLDWLTQPPDLPRRRQLLQEALAASTDTLFVELPAAEFNLPPDLLVRRALQLLDAEPALPEVPVVPFGWMSQQTDLPMRIIPLADQLVAFVDFSVPVIIIIGATTGPFRASYIPFLRNPALSRYGPATGPFRSSYIQTLRSTSASEYTQEIGPYAASYEPDTPPKGASSG